MTFDEELGERGTEPEVLTHSSVRAARVSRPRRELLRQLAAAPNESHTVAGLAQALVPAEIDAEDGDENRSAVVRAYEQQLRDVHLPALSAAGVVHHESGSGLVIPINRTGLVKIVEHLDAEEE